MPRKILDAATGDLVDITGFNEAAAVMPRKIAVDLIPSCERSAASMRPRQ